MESGNIIDHIRASSGDRLRGIQTKLFPQGSMANPQNTPGHEEPAVIHTPCAQVEIATFEGGIPQKIPTLLAMINSMLHLQTSPLVIERFLMTAQFQSLIAHFANLGPIARLYLLKTSTLSRLLRLLFINCTIKTGLTAFQAAQFACEFDQEGTLAKKAPLFTISGLYLQPNT